MSAHVLMLKQNMLSQAKSLQSGHSAPLLSPNTSQKCGCFSQLLICLHTLSHEPQMYMVRVFLMLSATCGISMEVFIQVSLLYACCFRFLLTESGPALQEVCYELESLTTNTGQQLDQYRLWSYSSCGVTQSFFMLLVSLAAITAVTALHFIRDPNNEIAILCQDVQTMIVFNHPLEIKRKTLGDGEHLLSNVSGKRKLIQLISRFPTIISRNSLVSRLESIVPSA